MSTANHKDSFCRIELIEPSRRERRCLWGLYSSIPKLYVVQKRHNMIIVINLTHDIFSNVHPDHVHRHRNPSLCCSSNRPYLQRISYGIIHVHRRNLSHKANKEDILFTQIATVLSWRRCLAWQERALALTATRQSTATKRTLIPVQRLPFLGIPLRHGHVCGIR